MTLKTPLEASLMGGVEGGEGVRREERVFVFLTRGSLCSG